MIYIYICIRVYTCVYPHVYAYMCTCQRKHAYPHTRMYTHTNRHTRIYEYLHSHDRLSACTGLHTCTFVNALCTHTHICMQYYIYENLSV